MESTAKARFIRMTPTKIARAVNLIRLKPVNDAVNILRYSTLSASVPVRKLVQSAAANLKCEGEKTGKEVDLNDYYVSEVFVGQGPTMKRMRARARGMGARIEKRSSHIFVRLSEMDWR